MSIRSLTKKRIEELKKKRDESMAEYEKVEKKTPKGMWKDELKKISGEFTKLLSIVV